MRPCRWTAEVDRTGSGRCRRKHARGRARHGMLCTKIHVWEMLQMGSRGRLTGVRVWVRMGSPFVGMSAGRGKCRQMRRFVGRGCNGGEGDWTCHSGHMHRVPGDMGTRWWEWEVWVYMVVIGVVELEVRTARTSFAPARLPVGVRGRVGFVGVDVG